MEILVDNIFPFADQTSPVQVLRHQGATIYSADGRAHLRVPPYALEADQQISLDQVAVAGSPTGSAYRILAADPGFSKAVTLVLDLPAEGMDNAAIHRLEGTSWQPLGGGLNDGGLLLAIDRPGTFTLASGSVATGSGDLVADFEVEPRHFRPRSGVGGDVINITFNLTREAQVEARIYSRAGRPRRVLMEGRNLGPGSQALVWDGTDADGRLLEAGLYIVAIKTGDDLLTKVIQIGRN